MDGFFIFSGWVLYNFFTWLESEQALAISLFLLAQPVVFGFYKHLSYIDKMKDENIKIWVLILNPYYISIYVFCGLLMFVFCWLHDQLGFRSVFS